MKALGGVLLSVAIGSGALFGLTHALKNVDYHHVFAIIRDTDLRVIALALMLVVASYGSITLYDWLALHTMGRKDVPYRIAALAGFTRTRASNLGYSCHVSFDAVEAARWAGDKLGLERRGRT